MVKISLVVWRCIQSINRSRGAIIIPPHRCVESQDYQSQLVGSPWTRGRQYHCSTIDRSINKLEQSWPTLAHVSRYRDIEHGQWSIDTNRLAQQSRSFRSKTIALLKATDCRVSWYSPGESRCIQSSIITWPYSQIHERERQRGCDTITQ